MDDNKNQNQTDPAASDYQKILDEYAASVKSETAPPSENIPQEKIPADSLKETISLPQEPKKITAQTTEKNLTDELEEAIAQKKPSDIPAPTPPSPKIITTSQSESPIHPSLAANLETEDDFETSQPQVTPTLETQPETKPQPEPQIAPPTITQTPEPQKTPEEIKAEINRLLTEDETNPSSSTSVPPRSGSSVGKIFFIFALILFSAVAVGLAYFLFLVPSNTNNLNQNTTGSAQTDSITPTSTPIESSDTCELNDKTYQVGESFASADGCNTCNCASAGVIACTEMACDISPTIIPATKSATTLKSTLIEYNSTHNLYTNNKFGFSVNIPKTISNKLSSCQVDIPLTFFENEDIIYIAGESFYRQDNNCQQEKTTLKLLSNESTLPITSMRIYVASLKNNTELERFIKSKLGSGCSLGEKTETKNSGIVIVKILGDGKAFDESNCMSDGEKVVYNQNSQKVAIFGVGQAHDSLDDISETIKFN